MTIVEFLRARYDDDERVARAAIADDRGEDCGFQHASWLTDSTFVRPAFASDAATMIRTFAVPRRVLREVEAKRRVLDALLTYEADLDLEHGSNETPPERIDGVRTLAAVYADHPDYDPSWSPA